MKKILQSYNSFSDMFTIENIIEEIFGLEPKTGYKFTKKELKDIILKHFGFFNTWKYPYKGGR